MKVLLTSGFLLLVLLAGPFAATASIWPFGSVYKTKVGSAIIAKRHEYEVLRRVNRYGGGCLHRYLGKRWAWRTKVGKWTLYNAKGERLSPHRYKYIEETPNGLVIGRRKIGHMKEIGEYVAPTGKITRAWTYPPTSVH